MKNKILIVVSKYYEEVANNLLDGAKNALIEKNYEFEISTAPGCFEIPYVINHNIEKMNKLGHVFN